MTYPITIHFVANPAWPVDSAVAFALYLVGQAQAHYPGQPRALQVDLDPTPDFATRTQFHAALQDALTASVARYVQTLQHGGTVAVSPTQDNDVPAIAIGSWLPRGASA